MGWLVLCILSVNGYMGVNSKTTAALTVQLSEGHRLSVH